MATRPPARARSRVAVPRDRPFLNTNFTVEIAASDVGSISIGFCEVILPEMPVHRPDTRAAAEGPEAARARLVLRRGFDGTAALRNWWNDARRRKTPRLRTVTVCLLAEDAATTVATWSFLGARPVSLAYSPLHASEPAVVIETLALEFDDVELR